MIEVNGTMWGTATEIADALDYTRPHIVNTARKHNVGRLEISGGHVFYDFHAVEEALIRVS